MKYSPSSKLLVIIAFLVVGITNCIIIEDHNDVPSIILETMKDKDPETIFKTFMTVFGKQYSFASDEGQRRFNTFKQTLANIKKHNEQNEHKTKFGITALSDITEDEYYKSIKNNQKPYEKSSPEIVHEIVNEKFDPIDWRKSIPFMKREGWSQDGSAEMSFALLFAYESANALATGTYTALSAPQIFSCLNYNKRYTYMNDKGLFSEKDYPTPKEWWKIRTTCDDSKKTGNTYKISAEAKTNLEGHAENPLISRSSRDLYSYLKRGPVLINFAASWDKFKNYNGGIFTSDQLCSSCNACPRYNYGLLVGYGIDSTSNTDYWIIKTHNGDSWGEDGSYMRLARNENGLNNGLTCYWVQPLA